MDPRRGRGAGFVHEEASSARTLFRRGGSRFRHRRDRYRNSDNRCMLREKGQRVYAHWADVSDYGSSNADSHDEIGSSSHALPGIVSSRRKRILDDALFDFFSKEAIKSLKRDFSKFCMGSDIWTENKRAKVSGIDKSCFTVYSSKYFFEVLHRLTDEQKCVIQKFGFNCLLAFAKTHIPSFFIRWLACCVDPDSSQIIVDDKIMNLSKDSLHFVLGLPNSGAEVVDNRDGGMELIMSLFHLSEVPHITFFGDKLKSNDPLTDQEVFVCFMQIAVSCFLCPCSNDRLDTKYIHQLGDPERASNSDVCQLVYNHLIHGITKTIRFIKAKGRKPKSFEFCSYALAVYYLDGLDFGAHIAGSGVPRSVSWCGDMIREYSELDRKSKRGFGRRRMRTDLASCYLNTIDGIFDIVQCFNSSQLGNSNKSESLVHNLLQFLSNARPWYKSSNAIQKDLGHLDTPVGLANNPVVENPNITAPKMHPVAKVKTRLTLQLPQNCAPDLCQSDLISPIGRMNLSPSFSEREACKVAGNSVAPNLLSKTSKGTKKAPIPAGDATPKAILVEESPEVTITGTSSFKDRQNQHALDADAIYNKTVHPKTSHVSNPMKTGPSLQAPAEVVEVVDIDQVSHKRSTTNNGLVILQPKNSLVFPLAHNSRFPVSDDDIMHFCAIVELAYTERIQKNYALVYHGVHCSYISLGQTLMRDGHIDNFLIPCFCRKLFEDNHPSKSGRHYFFPYIGESILELSNSSHESLVRTSFLGAATASRGKRLDLSDR